MLIYFAWPILSIIAYTLLRMDRPSSREPGIDEEGKKSRRKEERKHIVIAVIAGHITTTLVLRILLLTGLIEFDFVNLFS